MQVQTIKSSSTMNIELPKDVAPYKRTQTFNQSNLPDGFLNNHKTKSGVWGVIHVVTGNLRYTIVEPHYEQMLTPDILGIVQPEQLHNVKPIGDVEFYVEFHKLSQ